MAFTKIAAAGIGTTETVTVDGLTVINNGSFGGNLTVSGVLTYEDVTNVDSVGLITARNGIVVGSGITLSKDGDIFATGITTVSGNVKVGTGITLSPDGNIFATGISTLGGDIQMSGDNPEFEMNAGGPRFRVPASNTLTIHTGGGLGSTNEERLRIDSSGRVLIGSTTADDAAQMLKVARTSGTSRLAIQAANDGSSQLDFADVADADIGRIQYDHTSNYMALFTNNSEALRITSAGRVGIGENSPDAPLHISTPAATTCEIRLTSNNTGSNQGDRGRINVYSALNDGTAYQAGYVDIDRSSGTDDIAHLLVALNDGSSVAERIRITGGGDFGIGLTPSYKFHVKGGNVDQTARFDNSKTADGNINYIGVCLGNAGTTGTGLFGMTGHSTAGSQACWIGMAGDDVAGGYGLKVFRGGNAVNMQRFAIGTQDHSGFVVGTDASMIIAYSKTYRFGLHIRPTDNDTGGGSPAIFQNAAGTTIGSITANASNVAFNTSSDYRLKENDISIIDGITRLKKLRPIKFNWKTDTEKTVDGFLAHEVSSSVPEAVIGEKDAVNEDGSINPQQLDYSKLVPLLTAALQEEIAKRESLEARLDAAGL